MNGVFFDAFDTEKLAMQASDESNVLVIPALTGLGAPYWDASAVSIGLTRDSISRYSESDTRVGCFSHKRSS